VTAGAHRPRRSLEQVPLVRAFHNDGASDSRSPVPSLWKRLGGVRDIARRARAGGRTLTRAVLLSHPRRRQEQERARARL